MIFSIPCDLVALTWAEIQDVYYSWNRDRRIINVLLYVYRNFSNEQNASNWYIVPDTYSRRHFTKYVRINFCLLANTHVAFNLLAAGMYPYHLLGEYTILSRAFPWNILNIPEVYGWHESRSTCNDSFINVDRAISNQIH